MCGITGIIDWTDTMDAVERRRTLQTMNAALLHRGPDEAGELHDARCSLGMRRLSIIDQAGGQQPVYNETGDIGIVFNGEIYNFQTLKADLIQKGHIFKTVSDTETIVHLYEEYGTDGFVKLHGMFAFCLYDQKKELFYIVRDRFGEKPLYYYRQDRGISFSSEINSLLQDTRIPRRLNHEALPYYFRSSLVPEPLTLLAGVRSLLPGHFLRISAKEMTEETYYQPTYPSQPTITDEAEAIEAVRPVLERAIQKQTISDVPVGAFLSGGIDSSTVVAFLQKNSTEQLKTFTVRFEHQAYDESKIARKVADHCGTDHHEITVPNVDFSEAVFWKIIDHVGLPFRDSSAIPTYLITKAIAGHVRVALSGDGGDELFGGYDLFQWYQKMVNLKQIPSPIRGLTLGGLSLAQAIPGLNQVSLLRQLHRGIRTSLLPLNEIPIALNEMFTSKEMEDLQLADWRNFEYKILKKYPAAFEDWSPLRRIMYYRLRHTLPANMLIKVDRMSMANSLEVRAPFLDPDLFNIAAQLSDELLINDGKGKYLIRKIMADALPDEVFNHPKQGFNMPLQKYQNSDFKKLAEKLLFNENPWPDFFSKSVLKNIYQRGLSTKKDTAQLSVFRASHQLWMVMMLLGWAKRFGVEQQ